MRTPPTRPTLHVQEGRFWRGDQPHLVVSGGIHYFRVHPDLWEDRLRRLRAMGLNTIETYLAWNFHETSADSFDFSGPRDVARFVGIADSLGLDVIVRPGPYICAEWEFGGLPGRLVQEGVALRSSDPAYLAEVDHWLDVACEVIRPLLATNGGPVVMVQVENEYGSYADDRDYLQHCHDALLTRGIDVLLCTSDGPGPDWLAHGTIPGVLATANFGSRVDEALTELRKVQPAGPDMCMEYWNGWFDHWGEEHHRRDAADAAQCLDDLLRQGASVNLYMAHGGTNFGLWSGANSESGTYQPTVTSYDYDAAVGEGGELTEKFHAFREVIARYLPVPDEVPATPARLRAATAAVEDRVALLQCVDRFGPAVRTPHPQPMEALGQDRGLILYRGHGLVPPDGRRLYVDGLADRAIVLADGEPLGVLDRNDAGAALDLTPRRDGRATAFDVLVENQGRINFAAELGEHKGATGIRIAHRFLMGWDSIPVRLDEPGFVSDLPFGSDAADVAPGPQFARAWLEIDAPADGSLAFPGWGKGFAWLNGELLGRYWERGPQVTLYAPAPLWRAGRNEVVVLELEHPGASVELRDEPDLG